MTRLLDECKAGKLCLGTLVQDNGTIIIDTLAKAGFSWVFLDMMHGTLDWKDVHHMATAARAAGMTSVVRIPNFPWSGAESVPDGRIVADAAHAAALGADGVRCSVSDAGAARRMAAIANDWHRLPIVHTTGEQFDEAGKRAKEELILMPIIESVRAFHDLDEIMSIDGINTVMISGTDLPRQLLGLSLDYEHPEVWRYLDKCVEMGHRHGVVVGFNTGYSFTGIEETAARIERLKQHGVGFILVQTLDHIVHSYVSQVVQGAKARIK